VRGWEGERVRGWEGAREREREKYSGQPNAIIQ